MSNNTMKKLRDRHPKGAEALNVALLEGEDTPGHNIIYDAITYEMARKASIETNGVVSPSGMNAASWRRLITSKRYNKEAANISATIAQLARKMCREKYYHVEPVTACWLIPRKKQPDGI